ncbi:MAG: DUF5681 domain-containing protein [Nitrososphaera sp.]
MSTSLDPSTHITRASASARVERAVIGPRIKGRFVKGTTGNPGGRPKGGGKNKLQLHREAIREAVDQELCGSVVDILKVVIKAAKAGDLVAAKMMLDRFVPVQKAADPVGAAAGGIQIIVQGFVAPEGPEVLDGDYEVLST